MGANPSFDDVATTTLQLYEDEGLFDRAARMAPVFEAKLHSLKGEPHVIDIRNYGLAGAVELASRPDAPNARAFETFVACFDQGVLVRQAGDIIALAPALIVEEAQIDEMVETLRSVLRTIK